jgi:hypothetical protein
MNSDLWFACPNCCLAFNNEGEYRHHHELDHPKRKFRNADLIRPASRF